ncbi:hypothetical protein Sjap_015485 [Stephania japonica]|uniref:Bromo domain-containing protein n=1 Tax=Stephania japonica TaxID=461633 RepID=A0AAP0IKA8_9MAGN
MLLENHSLNMMKRTPLKFIKISTMPCEENISVKKKLKVKLARVEGSSEFSQHSSWTSAYATSFRQEQKADGTVKLRCSGKRGMPESGFCGQKLKKVKIGRRVMQQCEALVKKLMDHQYGFLFNQPVDPEALQIPDYLDIISEPMDLGTIKKKLENGEYSSARDFAADVRLTFTNAMKYNPPTNWVHELAGEFSRVFTSGWKSLEAKWSVENSDVVYKDRALISEGNPPKAAQLKEHCLKTATTMPMLSAKFSQMQQLEKNLKEISKRELPLELEGRLRRLGLLCQNKEDGETAWEIQMVVRSYFNSNVGKFANTGGTCGLDSSFKDPHNENNNHKCDSATSKRLGNPAACPKGSFGDMKSRCSRNNDLTEALTGSDTDSKHSSSEETYHPCQSKLLNMEASINRCDNGQTTSSDLYSADRPNNTCSVQLSPSKALRAAMLRSRFMDTIMKAQQEILLSNGEKINPIMMKQEKERLEKQQREEKARIEAHIKAAKEEAELKLLRRRQAARLALEEMEKSVDIYDGLTIIKELETMGIDTYFGHDRVLEDLGLYLRNEVPEDSDEVEG